MGKERLRDGYVQIYTGDGKGKTTAALGLALRASGRGMRTYIGQFMKGQQYGELDAIAGLPLITIEQYGDPKCIRREEVTAEHVAQARSGLARAREAMASGEYDIVVLDEVNVAIWFGLFSEEDVLELVDAAPSNMEIILTGRNASDRLIGRADLVTEMVPIKHYYEQGVRARNGIER